MVPDIVMESKSIKKALSSKYLVSRGDSAEQSYLRKQKSEAKVGRIFNNLMRNYQKLANLNEFSKHFATPRYGL